jgi:hypothetical protein
LAAPRKALLLRLLQHSHEQQLLQLAAARHPVLYLLQVRGLPAHLVYVLLLLLLFLHYQVQALASQQAAPQQQVRLLQMLLHPQ